MAARTWFTVSNTNGLTTYEIKTLNRAARIYLSGTTKPDLSRADLVALRLAFRPDASASQIASAVHDADEAVSS